ncbi:hypothetical protein F4802DRAFT_194101 [Xylaria palmicola]|nr:hypothetical protein F4802DRAFT_194101 [Xylaria palmicola]
MLEKRADDRLAPPLYGDGWRSSHRRACTWGVGARVFFPALSACVQRSSTALDRYLCMGGKAFLFLPDAVLTAPPLFSPPGVDGWLLGCWAFCCVNSWLQRPGSPSPHLRLRVIRDPEFSSFRRLPFSFLDGRLGVESGLHKYADRDMPNWSSRERRGEMGSFPDPNQRRPNAGISLTPPRYPSQGHGPRLTLLLGREGRSCTMQPPSPARGLGPGWCLRRRALSPLSPGPSQTICRYARYSTVPLPSPFVSLG